MASTMVNSAQSPSPPSRAEFLRAMTAAGAASLALPLAARLAAEDTGGMAAPEDGMRARAGAQGVSADGAEAPGAADAGPDVSILLATDIHYLSPRLPPRGALGGTTVSSGAMMTDWTDPIADALVREVVAARPDAFVMPGDLSFDGELESHVDFVGKLREIADAGIPVLVIPGNHDVSGADSRSDDVSPDLFAQMYEAFGPAGALSRDAASLSYVWELPARDAGPGRARPSVRLLFADCNAVEQMGTVPAETLAWVSAQLDDAAEAGARVLAFSHQMLLGNDGGYYGLWINNASDLQELYERAGVAANFSGHVHGQNVARSEAGLVDATTASLAIYPFRYAEIDLYFSDGGGAKAGAGAGAPAGRLAYRARSLNVDAWAAETGSSDPDLLGFHDFARAAYHELQESSMREVLVGLGAGDDEADEIAGYYADVATARQDGDASAVERRQDVIDRFAELAGSTTASRFTAAFDPGLARAPLDFEIALA